MKTRPSEIYLKISKERFIELFKLDVPSAENVYGKKNLISVMHPRNHCHVDIEINEKHIFIKVHSPGLYRILMFIIWIFSIFLFSKAFSWWMALIFSIFIIISIVLVLDVLLFTKKKEMFFDEIVDIISKINVESQENID